MKIHEGIEQGSLEWLTLRSGKVTASELNAIITPLGKIRTGDGVRTYRMRKLAERWLGRPLPSDADGIWDLEQGHILEEYARPAFTLETGLLTRKVGFISNDDCTVGCSPDGLIEGDKSGLELKCPHLETHIGYVLNGEVPEKYVAQVQGSLYVTGFDHWYFASYRRGLSMMVVKVEPDPNFQASLALAIETFLEDLDADWKAFIAVNGPPPERKPFTPSEPGDPRAALFQGLSYQEATGDVIP